MNCWSYLLAIALISLTASIQSFSQTTLQARSQLLNAETPWSYPETFVMGSHGEIYVLDTDLSSLFALNTRNGKLNRICGPEKLASPADLAIDRKGNLWVLSALHSKILKLNLQCEVQREIVSRGLPLKIESNSFGEVIVLKGAGPNLFETYGPDGKLLQAFGQRLDYNDETTNSELSDGHIVADRAGGFFFSFNYPPLIRHYGRKGNLITEFKPESEVAIAPPKVSVRKHGNSMAVSSTYQILVLDMAVDAQDRLYLLLSGKFKIPALTGGTRKLAVVTSTGRVLKTADLEYNFHRLMANNRHLYLLRNRKPFRLDTYSAL